VICERKQTDFEKIATNVYEVEYEITLRNHKATAIGVEVNEPVGGTWRMITSSHQWTKTSAWAAQFKVPGARCPNGRPARWRVRVCPVCLHGPRGVWSAGCGGTAREHFLEARVHRPPVG